MKKTFVLTLFVTIVALIAYARRDNPSPARVPAGIDATAPETPGAFDRRADNTQVEGRASVVKLLPDDNEGSRHQRFIIRLASGQTILISHNTDLAPRVVALRPGDEITFSGEYEWNDKGGVVHWTHRDPDNRHQAGWIRHNGQLFH